MEPIVRHRDGCDVIGCFILARKNLRGPLQERDSRSKKIVDVEGCRRDCEKLFLLRFP